MNLPQTRNETLPADPNDNPYLTFGNFVPQNRIVGHLLRFTKFGEWTAGQDGAVLSHGTKLIAHMGEIILGWQRWEDNKPVEQVMGLVRDNFKPPTREQLGHTDEAQWETDDNGLARDPWQKTAMIIFKAVDGDELYTYSTSSHGGLSALDKLSKEYGKHMRMRPNQFPVVELGLRSYVHDKYGEMRAPTFKIVNWTNRDEIDRVLEGGEEQADRPPREDKQLQHALTQGETAKPKNERKPRF